jgi:hypothetical protein
MGGVSSINIFFFIKTKIFMYRAVLEGVCFQVRDIFEVILEHIFFFTKTLIYFSVFTIFATGKTEEV